MDPKDLLGEADRFDYACRLPLYSTMELFIETLTGTCFELRVSPYETVISVKAKIQRLEGIPISQQYLIWQNTELEDDYCLHDYNITDGCTLKLVLAMRGGPINTRRIAVEDPGIRDMADYMESSHEELLDKLSPPPSEGNSNKQVTLLVYRDGDQLNLFRVVDRGDGTLTPFSDSISGSACNLRDGDDDDTEEETAANRASGSPGSHSLSVAQMVENNVTAAKMKRLRTHFQALSVTSSPAQTKQQVPSSSFQKSKLVTPQPPSAARCETDRRKPSPRRKEIADRLTTAQTVAPAPPAAKTSSPTTGRSSDIFLRRESPTPDAKNVGGSTPPSPPSTTPARVDELRSRLKRMKRVESSNEEQTDEKPENVLEPESGEEQLGGQDAANVEEASKATTEDSKSGVSAAEPPSNSGRFSPRTRRLLNALENNGNRRHAHHPPPALLPRKPRASSLMHGLTYNRHDLYLRSYGLIPSPDDHGDDGQDNQVTSAAAGGDASKTTKKQEDEPGSQVHETVHGVKYSSVGGTHLPQYLGTGSRFLKTPPMWNPYDAGLQSGAGGAIWHPALKANASIDPDSVKPPLASRPALDHAAPPESNRKCVPAVDKLATSLTNKHNALPGHDLVDGSLKTNAGLNRKVKTTPHPPAPATSTLSSLWQRRRLRDMPAKAPHGVPHGPTLPAGNLPSWRADNDFGEVPHLSPRRPLRDVSSKSGLRVKESQHGKVESMSRQEAREVVDFINKAMDASILRTLVRSPMKDAQRGHSGNSSGRIRTSYSRTADNNRTALRSSHGSQRTVPTLPPTINAGGASRAPQVLPPVKPPSKKKRCFLCAKRTGLASSYLCRCGNNFCATHRYAEMHDCTYDYKAAGRKLLEETNPLVSAPKLPKI